MKNLLYSILSLIPAVVIVTFTILLVRGSGILSGGQTGVPDGTEQTEDVEPTARPGDTDQKGRPGDTEPAGQPGEPGRPGTQGDTEQPGDAERTETPGDAVQPGTSGQTARPGAPGDAVQPEGTEESETQKTAGAEDGPLIVIDAGHQGRENSQKEPVGPGAVTKKAKVAGGTTGVNSGVPESELTLAIALLLEEELERRGYTVVQIRTEQDVDISNRERSETANELGADAFIRLHANGSESARVNGAQTICPAEDNPYLSGELIEESYRLSECILDAYTEETGCRKEYVSERNDMTGINWCEVPVTILEMGYMTNPAEDARMQDADYQEKMVTGIANGVDAYFEKN